MRIIILLTLSFVFIYAQSSVAQRGTTYYNFEEGIIVKKNYTLGDRVFNSYASRLELPAQIATSVAIHALAWNSLHYTSDWTHTPNTIQGDKYGHLLATSTITTLGMQVDPIFGVALGIAVGFGKEIYDSKTGGQFSWPDMYANTTGVLIGIFWHWGMHYFQIYSY